MNGWIKLYRKIMENPIVAKDADHLAIWVYLLLNATHDEYPALFKGKKIQLKPGQLLTGRKAISERLAISESKVQRVLDDFKSEQQIEQQTSNKNRLISIVNWDFYQGSEQQSELQMNDKRTTDEQQVNTNKNVKNDKNINNNIYSRAEDDFAEKRKSIVGYLNTVCKTAYRHNSKNTVKHINARLKEGYTEEDFKRVIDKKAKEWLGTNMEQYLRPETLFGTKFEGYLNQKITTEKEEDYESESSIRLW